MKVEIKDTGDTFENIKRPIVLTDKEGTEYRISFDPYRGVIITKMAADGPDAIRIEPKERNEIYVY